MDLRGSVADHRNEAEFCLRTESEHAKREFLIRARSRIFSGDRVKMCLWLWLLGVK